MGMLQGRNRGRLSGGARAKYFPVSGVHRKFHECARSAHRERVSAKLYAGGVQGPALGPLAGCRGRAPAGGPGGGAPGSSRELAILNLEDGRYFKPNLAQL